MHKGGVGGMDDTPLEGFSPICPGDFFSVATIFSSYSFILQFWQSLVGI